MQVIRHHRVRLDAQREAVRQQVDAVLNPLTAVLEGPAGQLVLTAEPGATYAARYAVVSAGDGRIDKVTAWVAHAVNGGSEAWATGSEKSDVAVGKAEIMPVHGCDAEFIGAYGTGQISYRVGPWVFQSEVSGNNRSGKSLFLGGGIQLPPPMQGVAYETTGRTHGGIQFGSSAGGSIKLSTTLPLAVASLRISVAASWPPGALQFKAGFGNPGSFNVSALVGWTFK